jgi:putative DNA primase/helicase
MSAILGVMPQNVEAPACSEEALALRFADTHAASLRYVDLWRAWFIFDGKKWIKDETRQSFSLSRDLCRDEAAQVNTRPRQLALATARTRAAVLSLASDDRRLAASTDQWDADRWLLNTPDGVVDLRTGISRPSVPEDYLTKLTAVGQGGECPTWLSFLQKIAGQADVIAYLQRVAGYCLTGLTTEHALFFVHGLGANGKSVFINTLAGILGDYHRTAPVETFTASSMDRHPTELATLRGARLVTAIETEEGRRWAESRIKALTGGDKISARFMRQDFFEYLPQFKLLIAGNHKPGLRTVDEAIRRRFNLIPFEVTIPPDQRNPHLADELKAEWPGILRWAVEGCMAWQEKGLSPPPKVIDATKAYLESEDAFEQWMDDCCILKADSWTAVGALFGSWRRWADNAGEFVGSERRFSQTLTARGFQAHRKKFRGFLGLELDPYPPI